MNWMRQIYPEDPVHPVKKKKCYKTIMKIHMGENES